MFGKVFESIFDSTLLAEGGWLPTYIFMSMLAIADKDGYVEIAPKVLYSKIGFRGYDNKITYEDFDAALGYLSNPDDYSKSTDFDGRRIIPVSELPDVEGARGWWIVNYTKYRDRASREDRASQSTERSKQWRERKKGNKNNEGTQRDALGRTGRHTDVDKDIKDNSSKFDEFWNGYPKKDNKKKSRTAFEYLSLDKQEKAIADSKVRYNGTAKQYIPLATTYCHGERWNDEIDSNGPDKPFGAGGI
jgi:hypothetical protein